MLLPNLPPGPYRIQVSKVGFKTLIKPDVILNVQWAVAINFTLPVGALSETVTVEGGAPAREHRVSRCQYGDRRNLWRICRLTAAASTPFCS